MPVIKYVVEQEQVDVVLKQMDASYFHSIL